MALSVDIHGWPTVQQLPEQLRVSFREEGGLAATERDGEDERVHAMRRATTEASFREGAAQELQTWLLTRSATSSTGLGASVRSARSSTYPLGHSTTSTVPFSAPLCGTPPVPLRAHGLEVRTPPVPPPLMFRRPQGPDPRRSFTVTALSDSWHSSSLHSLPQPWKQMPYQVTNGHLWQLAEPRLPSTRQETFSLTQATPYHQSFPQHGQQWYPGYW